MELLQIHNSSKNFWVSHCRTLFLCTVLIVLGMSGFPLAVAMEQRTFASPEKATKAVVEALKAHDSNALTAIFGPRSEDLISSGDPVADAAERERFISLYVQKYRLEAQGTDKMILCLGDEDWPFPIPIVKDGEAWRFDTPEGREELLARRIGRNELSVIQTCLAYVDAQQEFALKDNTNDGFREYAQEFISDPGKKNGLYWKAKEGDEQSPLGPLVAAAQEKGYTGKPAVGEPIPYHGYYYKILKAQGKNAPGGAYDYVVKGKMIGGFALVAYPAQYGSSGIMTFIVNQDGVVYQEDLGEDTGKIAPTMKLFNPDRSWKRVEQEI